jgi:hypothetical protein
VLDILQNRQAAITAEHLEYERYGVSPRGPGFGILLNIVLVATGTNWRDVAGDLSHGIF